MKRILYEINDELNPIDWKPAIKWFITGHLQHAQLKTETEH